jgi:hypothetical protein
MLTIVESAPLDLLVEVLEVESTVAEGPPDVVRVTPCITFISNPVQSTERKNILLKHSFAWQRSQQIGGRCRYSYFQSMW